MARRACHGTGRVQIVPRVPTSRARRPTLISGFLAVSASACWFHALCDRTGSVHMCVSCASVASVFSSAVFAICCARRPLVSTTRRATGRTRASACSRQRARARLLPQTHPKYCFTQEVRATCCRVSSPGLFLQVSHLLRVVSCVAPPFVFAHTSARKKSVSRSTLRMSVRSSLVCCGRCSRTHDKRRRSSAWRARSRIVYVCPQPFWPESAYRRSPCVRGFRVSSGRWSWATGCSPSGA